MVYFSRMLVFSIKVIRRLYMHIVRFSFSSYGRNFIFDPFGTYSFKSIDVGDDVYIGNGAVMLAENSFIKIGKKVMFGPNVTVLAGNHRTDIVGRYMADISVFEKLPENDLGVRISEDVWVGANVTILDGVSVGRGAIIGAGSVVSKSVAPYAVVCGVPARVVKFRWDIIRVLEHEALLYPVEARLTPLDLEYIYKSND